MKSPHLLGKLEHTPGLQAELVVDPGLLNPELFFFFQICVNLEGFYDDINISWQRDNTT